MVFCVIILISCPSMSKSMQWSYSHKRTKPIQRIYLFCKPYSRRTKTIFKMSQGGLEGFILWYQNALYMVVLHTQSAHHRKAVCC